jgi:oligoribonuclease NrnB/cAMP/cGMP phosphodiesterase (DHH superfamily)
LTFDVLLTDYGGFEEVFSAISLRKKTLIVITDLGMDDSSLDSIITSLKRAISQGCRVVWLDHHQWSKRAIAAIQSLENKPILRINHEYCAAEIAHKSLMAKDDISAELATIAHDTDFNLREIKFAGALTDALSVLRFNAMDRKEDLTEILKPLLIKLSDEGVAGLWDEGTSRFKDNQLNQRVKHYRKEKAKKMRKALSAHSDEVIQGRLIRIVELPHGVTTTDLGTFLSDETNLQIDEDTVLQVADLIITLSQGGMLGFRRGKDTVLCNLAAKHFNGGGHPYAAGGEYGSYEDFEAVCSDIFLTLSKNKDWIHDSTD